MRDGFRVLRFWNNEVDRNLDGVLIAIDDRTSRLHPTRPAFGRPPFPFGGGISVVDSEPHSSIFIACRIVAEAVALLGDVADARPGEVVGEDGMRLSASMSASSPATGPTASGRCRT